jgi:hypothetical protein
MMKNEGKSSFHVCAQTTCDSPRLGHLFRPGAYVNRGVAIRGLSCTLAGSPRLGFATLRSVSLRIVLFKLVSRM